MAEGFSAGPPHGPTDGGTEPRGAAAAARWLTATRNGRLTIFAVAVATALASVTAWHAFGTPILQSAASKALFMAGAAVFGLPLLLFLLDANDNLAKGPRLLLPMATLGVLAGLATLAAVDSIWQLGILSDSEGRVRAEPLIAFFAFLAVTIAARIASAIQFTIYKDRDAAERARDTARKRASGDATARAQAQQLDAQVREQNDAEALGAVIATLTVVGIGVLAFFAGGWSQGSSLRSAVGVGISIGVVGLFSVVVFLDWIAEFAPIRMASRAMRGFSRRMSWLASFYNTIDAMLVRIGAHVAGTEHHKARSRYTILAGTLACLGVMSFFLPAPFGLIPTVVGFILALSVSRLWSWVEDDRNLALITRFNPEAPKKVGFREDFKDETLLGFIFVLVLIPIAMMQIDSSRLFGAELFTGAGKDQLTAWLGYFGFELAKALPVVDWADIYNVRAGDDLLKPNGALGMHAVFAARATVDLVLIASLLQAIGIATRNRQQKSLYANRQINRVDELVEKEELKRAIGRPQDRWFDPGPIDFRLYDKDRLRELFSSSSNEDLRRFIGLIFVQSGETLDPAVVVLTRLAADHAGERDLYITLDAVKREHKHRESASVGDMVEVLTNLRSRSGLKDLKTDLIALAKTIGPAHEFADLAEIVMYGPLCDDFQYARIAAALVLTDAAPELPDPTQVSDLIAGVEIHRVEAFGSQQWVADKLLATLRKRLEELLGRHEDHENKP